MATADRGRAASTGPAPRARRRWRWRWRWPARRAPLVAAAVPVALLFLAPLVWMLRASFLPDALVLGSLAGGAILDPGRMDLANYADVMRRLPFGHFMWNSLVMVIGIIVPGLLLNAAAGYAFARLRFRGRDGLFVVVVALIIVPFESVLIPLFLLVNGMGLVNTYAGLILPFVVKAFDIYYLRTAFLALPRELELAARADGASHPRIFFEIALPQVRPALATVAVLDFMTHWGDFIWPLRICVDESVRTVQVGLSTFFHQPPIQWGDVMAFSVMATIPMALVFVLLQRYIVPTLARAGIRG